MSKVKVLPINSCRECPKLEEGARKCTLSKAEAYDLDEDWESYLEQFCPLNYLEAIIDEAYQQGMRYKEFKDDKIKETKHSVDENRWYTAHEYLEKINE